MASTPPKEAQLEQGLELVIDLIGQFEQVVDAARCPYFKMRSAAKKLPATKLREPDCR